MRHTQYLCTLWMLIHRITLISNNLPSWRWEQLLLTHSCQTRSGRQRQAHTTPLYNTVGHRMSPHHTHPQAQQPPHHTHTRTHTLKHNNNYPVPHQTPINRHTHRCRQSMYHLSQELSCSPTHHSATEAYVWVRGSQSDSITHLKGLASFNRRHYVINYSRMWLLE